MDTSEKEDKPTAFDISSLDIYVLLGLFLNVLNEKAWQDMGLRVKPGTDKAEKDLAKAKVAIDCVSFLVGLLDPHVDEAERRHLKGLVADLQINFVSQTG